MLTRIDKFISRTVIITIAITLFLLAGIYIWAITGPRSLENYIPQIEESLNEVLTPNKVRIKSAELSWGGFSEMLKVEAEDVHILNGENDIATIKKIGLDFNFFGLLVGKLIPKEITISESKVLIENIEASSDDEEIDFPEIESLKINIKNTQIISSQADIDIKQGEVSFKGKKANYSLDLLYENDFEIKVNGVVENQNGTTKIAANSNAINLAKFTDLIDGELLANLKIEIIEDKILAEIRNVQGNITGENLRRELQFENANLNIEYDLSEEYALIKNSDIKFIDGTEIKLEGRAKNSTELDINLKAEIDNLAVENLNKYWPKDVSNNAIEWIEEKTSGGVINNAIAKINISPEAYLNGKLVDEAVDVSFDLNGININYNNELLPIKNVNGEAKLNANTASMKVSSAKLGASKVTAANIVISDLGIEKGYEQLSATGSVVGSVKDIADFYEKKAIGKRYFKKSDVVSGTAKTQLKMKFPLDSQLKLEDIDLDIKSEVEGVEVTDFMDGIHAKNLSMNFHMDSIGTKIKGEFLANPRINNKIIKLSYMPTAFDLNIKDGVEKLNLIADLKNANIQIPALQIKKTTQEAAKLNVTKTAQGGYSKFNNIKLGSESISLNGNGVGDFSDFSKLEFSQIKFGKSQFAANIRKAKNSYDIAINGESFDVAPLIDYESEDNEDADENIKFSGTLNKILLKNSKQLNNAVISAECIKGECDNFSLKADGVDVISNEKSIKVTANDASMLLNGFDLYEHVIGGDLLLEADKINDGYKGKIFVKNFNIKKGKFLPQILTIGSLTGIADTLQGNGIAFKKLSIDFTKNDGMINIKNFRMYGAAIGLTAEGWVNQDKNQIKISGNLIPAYTANTILGKIPLLGDMIIGDDGIFAVSYKITGSLDNPEISVNPLSVLAPGIIKDLFN